MYKKDRVITASQVFNIDENVANTTVVDTALATDVDTVGSLQSWTITAGNADGNFAIDGSSGVITILNHSILNYEASPR